MLCQVVRLGQVRSVYVRLFKVVYGKNILVQVRSVYFKLFQVR